MIKSNNDSFPWGKTKKEHREYMKWWRNKNRKSYNEGRLNWAIKNKEKRTIQARNSYLNRKYGINNDEYLLMLEKQCNKCAICHQEIYITLNRRGNSSNSCHLDHCHKTGKIRGLLCHSCNNALGHFKDDINILNNAIKYLIDDKGVRDTDFFK